MPLTQLPCPRWNFACGGLERVGLGVLGLLLLAVGLHAAGPSEEKFRGSRVEWVRLATSDPYWNRHANSDNQLLRLLKVTTTLNVRGPWRSVSAEDISALTAHPMIYAADVSVLGPNESKNFAEYLRRGGFVLIDACINLAINPDPRVFFLRQVALLKQQLPELQVVELPPEHEIFSIFFAIKGGPPMTRRPDTWSKTETFPLRALMVKERMVGVISLCGLQCGWDEVSTQKAEIEAMKMATNIYIYAMSR